MIERAKQYLSIGIFLILVGLVLFLVWMPRGSYLSYVQNGRPVIIPITTGSPFLSFLGIVLFLDGLGLAIYAYFLNRPK